MRRFSYCFGDYVWDDCPRQCRVGKNLWLLEISEPIGGGRKPLPLMYFNHGIFD